MSGRLRRWLLPALLVITAASAAAASPPVAVPPPSALALRYYRSGNVLWIVSVAWSLLVPAAILLSGLSARLRDVCERFGRRRLVALFLFTTAYLVLTFVLDLPLRWFGGFVRQHAYGLSHQTAAKWITDALKELAVNIVIVPLVAAVPLALIRRTPRWWWLATGLLAAPLIAFSLLVAPVVFDPLFNRFHRMNDRQTESRILALAQRAGVDGSRVFEVDKSVDTNTINAYVSGLFGTKRIVVWDTTLAKLDQREVLVVVGHELGHFVLGHMTQIVVVGALATLAGLWLVHLAAGVAIGRMRTARLRALDDLAALPLLLLLFSLAMFALSPLLLFLSRHNEHEADRFGLEITHDNHAAATAFVKMQTDSLAVPRPGRLYLFFRASHPPLGDRVDFCNVYRPWERGEPLRYSKLIRR